MTVTSPDGLPPVLWLGGGSGAGKTTISLSIALRHDLAWYRIDAHGYAHRDRLLAGGFIEDSNETHEQRWIAPGPDELASRFIESSTQVFALILEDLRAMGTETGVVVEGPQLPPRWWHRILWMLDTGCGCCRPKPSSDGR